MSSHSTFTAQSSTLYSAPHRNACDTCSESPPPQSSGVGIVRLDIALSFHSSPTSSGHVCFLFWSVHTHQHRDPLVSLKNTYLVFPIMFWSWCVVSCRTCWALCSLQSGLVLDYFLPIVFRPGYADDNLCWCFTPLGWFKTKSSESNDCN